MSDIIVVDKADEAIFFAGSAVTDLDGLLGGVPDLIESVPDLVGDLLDHLTVSVLPDSLDLDELLDLDDLDGTVGHVLGIVPGTAGGVLSGLSLHLDGTVDVLLDQTLGVTAVLNPILEPVAEIVNQITMTLGVTDELPARLSALAGIAIVGSDSVLSNLTEILDATLGLNLGPVLDHTLGTVVGVVDDLTVSLGLGSLLDVVDVGLTQGPMTVEGTTDESFGAGHGLLDSLFTDADGLGDNASGGTVVIGVQGLAQAVPQTIDSTVDLVLTDTLHVEVPELVDHTTVGVGSLLEDPTSVGAIPGTDLVDETVTSVTTIADDTVTGLGLGLDLGGLG
ncbi:hypothetical protein [Sporichthya sp.]|uniref:hypothetical protein n=1 Tax=Sporichthya sp. TaxID=65475 RepID=UPI0017D7AC5F|nr:hypothetical protein [Sporichthya sp.]MBA3743160.1 hypothetical protein [Sporichthya sp.]